MMIRNRLAWAVAVVLIGGGAAWAQTTQPTTATPALATAEADYSDPKKAVTSFLRANDEKSLREALVIAPEKSREIEAFLGVMISTMDLQRAAQAQFGTASAQYFSKATDAQLQRRLRAVQAAEVTTRAPDAASISLPADPEARQAAAVIELKKVDGLWKIDAASLFGAGGGSPDKAAQRMQLAAALKGVTDQMIKDLPRFLSAGDAYQEYWNRSKDAATRVATGGATTQP